MAKATSNNGLTALQRAADEEMVKLADLLTVEANAATTLARLRREASASLEGTPLAELDARALAQAQSAADATATEKKLVEVRRRIELQRTNVDAAQAARHRRQALEHMRAVYAQQERAVEMIKELLPVVRSLAGSVVRDFGAMEIFDYTSFFSESLVWRLERALDEHEKTAKDRARVLKRLDASQDVEAPQGARYVRISQISAGPSGVHFPGDVVSMPAGEALAMVEEGFGEEVPTDYWARVAAAAAAQERQRRLPTPKELGEKFAKTLFGDNRLRQVLVKKLSASPAGVGVAMVPEEMSEELALSAILSGDAEPVPEDLADGYGDGQDAGADDDGEWTADEEALRR